MKKLFLLLATIMLVRNDSFAKIWRVNNNLGINADFTTLQAAHDGAAAGDTLYLESSPTNYGGLSSSKRLVIIGTGYLLEQNQGLQAFTLPSRISTMTLNTGSDGTIIEGLSFNTNAINIFAKDIIIKRNNFLGDDGKNDNYFGSINLYSSANIYITQNFGIKVYNPTAATGILISNNYIGYGLAYGEGTNGQCINLDPGTVAIIKNNIFRNGTVKSFNSNISNNIMYNGFMEGTGNLISNNIANGIQFGTDDGNKANVDMTTVFYQAGSFDASWQLKAASPAIGAGFGSTSQSPIDCGMYGGSFPYVLSGIPAIPSIYFFSNQPVGSNSDPIHVQIKVKSNN